MDDDSQQTAGGMPVPTNDTQPEQQPPAPETPDSQLATGPVIIGGAKPAGTKRKIGKKPLIVILSAAVVVTLATAAYVVGYYAPNRPSSVFRTALSNSAKGYDELVTYVNDEEVRKKFDTTEVQGDFRFESAELTTDGTIAAKMDGKNATFSGDIGLGVTRLEVEGVALDAANSDSPDVFLKFSGIKGLGAQFMDLPELDLLDGQWITVDHTLFDSAASQSEDSTAEASGFAAPTQADVVDALRAAGEVNKKYLFATEPGTAVLKMDTFVGKETVDGKSVNHYKVKANKENLKAYLKALGEALDGSKLGDWAESNYDKPLSQMVDIEGALAQADTIKDTDTYDMWVNTKTKLVHKMRFVPAGKDAAKNYVDIGLDYDGGAEKPFFLTVADGEDGTSLTKFTLALNTETDVIKVGMDMRSTGTADGTNDGTAAFNFTVKPGTGKVEVTVPEGTIPLAEALDKAGLSGFMQLLSGEAPAFDESMMDQTYLDPSALYL